VRPRSDGPIAISRGYGEETGEIIEDDLRQYRRISPDGGVLCFRIFTTS